MTLFYDSEFTGLTADSTLISLAFIDESGRSFYAEFSDFNRSQCDDWIATNVLSHCEWIDTGTEPFIRTVGEETQCYGDSALVRQHLGDWLSTYQQAEVWADCHAYDWVLLCQLFGGAFQLPKSLFYMPMDLVTLLRLKGIDPDIDRNQLSGLANAVRHNALDDAHLLRACYNKLMDN